MKKIQQILENNYPGHVVHHSPDITFGASDPIHMNFFIIKGVFIAVRHFSPAKHGDKPMIFYKEFKRYTFCGYSGKYIVYDKILKRQDSTDRKDYPTKKQCINACLKLMKQEYTPLK